MFCCLEGGGIFLPIFGAMSHKRAFCIFCQTPGPASFSGASILSVCPQSDFPKGPGFSKYKSVLPSKSSLCLENQNALLLTPPFQLRNPGISPLVLLMIRPFYSFVSLPVLPCPSPTFTISQGCHSLLLVHASTLLPDFTCQLL